MLIPQMADGRIKQPASQNESLPLGSASGHPPLLSEDVTEDVAAPGPATERWEARNLVEDAGFEKSTTGQ
jgi:hypothetical protein